MKVDLHYLNNPPFTDTDLEQKGLGGTEGFIVQSARELARQGHQVRLYNRSPVETQSSGVLWSNISRFNPQEDRDVFISFRMREIFKERPKGLKVIILADTESIGLGDDVRNGLVDLVMFVSQWQKDKIAAEENIPDEHCMVTANGIRLNEFDKQIDKVQGMCIHTSTPERGLSHLLDIWPKIQVLQPEASLHLFSSYYGWGAEETQNQEMCAAQYAQAEYLAKTGHNVVNHIHVGAEELREWQLKSELFLYPTAFRETCCLHGDTIINMPSDHRYGQGIPIKYLAGESDFPVYTYNEKTHRFKLGTAKKVWKSREGAETLKIYFEEGDEITITPDHLVYNYDGEWVQAGSLKPGDRLTGITYKYRVNVNIGDGNETPEARLVGEWIIGRKLRRGEHAHHIDAEGLDNSPDMIDVLPAHIHHTLTHRGKIMHPTSTRIARQGFSEWAQTEEGQTYLKKRNSKSVQKMWEKMRSLPEDEFAEWLRARRAKSLRSYYANKSKLTEEELEELHEIAVQRGREGSDKAWSIIRSWPEEKQKRYFHDRAVKGWETRRKNLAAQGNHIIKSIERGPVADVYDMEVEPYHNFVAGGVVVHNCISSLEASAAGCVLICSDVAALHERVIDGETGYLIPGEVGTSEHDWNFVSKVNSLLMDQAKLMSMAHTARAYARSYDFEVLVWDWVNKWQSP